MSDFTAVSEKERLSVYKKALTLIKNLEYKHSMTTHALCLLLPSILWDLDDYLDNSPDGRSWNTYDAKKLFPELTDEVIAEIENEFSVADSNNIRIKYLEQWILQLS